MITEAALPLLAFQLKPAEATLTFLLKVSLSSCGPETICMLREMLR